MGAAEGVIWNTVNDISENEDQDSLLVQLWEYFSTAAAGVCQLYRGKVDRCADFRSLIDALQPMDQFFKGSQQFIEAALNQGKCGGARRLRLRLRAVQLLLTYGFGLPTGTPGHQSTLGKRKRHRTCCVARLSRNRAHVKGVRCPTNRTASHTSFRDSGLQSVLPNRLSPDNPYGFSGCDSGFPTTVPVTTLQNSLLFSTTDVKSDKQRHQISASRRKRRCWDAVNHGSDLPRDCFVSCETDRYRATVGEDPFNTFQDAVRMANLLDPLSKVSVTSWVDQSTEINSKRPRLDRSTDGATDLAIPLCLGSSTLTMNTDSSVNCGPP
ncbi:hypothetical protein FGIG_05291 [Fasciola gigantica]|uniref:Uncharacterized protein n=1 Tax=Fasciola gigantica TaxID=46835 RepID=A0A504YRZ9_FASGI|nr:hypothetical protein FGIG_05291 [Fasciola gigantica]